MQALAAAVNERRNRQTGTQEECVLNLLGDEAAILISIKFSQRMAQRRYLHVRDAAHEAAAAYIDEQTERALGDLPEQEKALKASSRRSKAT